MGGGGGVARERAGGEAAVGSVAGAGDQVGRSRGAAAGIAGRCASAGGGRLGVARGVSGGGICDGYRRYRGGGNIAVTAYSSRRIFDDERLGVGGGTGIVRRNLVVRR